MKEFLRIMLVTAVAASVHAGVVAPKAALDGFLGGEGAGGAVLVYVKAADGFIYYVDLNTAPPVEKLLCDDVAPAGAPLVSPDGRMVAFDNQAGKYYVCPLAENATATEIGSGYDPHWWGKGDSTFIIYRTQSGKYRWPMPGDTYRQPVDVSGAAPAAYGTASLVAPYSFNGGLSKNGRYLCTAYRDAVIYDLADSSHYILHGGDQTCNASISPSDTEQDRMMMLSLAVNIDGTAYASHETFCIRNMQDSLLWYTVIPPGVTEWQNPEWSTDYGFCTVTAQHGEDYHVYIVRTFEDDDYIEVVDGNNQNPHLWLGRTSPVRQGVSEPRMVPAFTVDAVCSGGKIAVALAPYAGGSGLVLRSPDGVEVRRWTAVPGKNELGVDGLEPGVYLLSGTVAGRAVVRPVVIAR